MHGRKGGGLIEGRGDPNRAETCKTKQMHCRIARENDGTSAFLARGVPVHVKLCFFQNASARQCCLHVHAIQFTHAYRVHASMSCVREKHECHAHRCVLTCPCVPVSAHACWRMQKCVLGCASISTEACVCVCVCACVHVCVGAFMCVRVRACVRVFMRVHVCIRGYRICMCARA